jgi:hypothetical protein
VTCDTRSNCWKIQVKFIIIGKSLSRARVDTDKDMVNRKKLILAMFCECRTVIEIENDESYQTRCRLEALQ